MHHFSFAAHQRADRIEWGGLRAVNIYHLEPGAERPPTFHADFEILTLVLGGCLRRTGSFACDSPFAAGSAELISTGTGADLGFTAVGPNAADYVEIWLHATAQARTARRAVSSHYPVGAEAPLAGARTASSGQLRLSAPATVHRALLDRSATRSWSIHKARAYIVILDGRLCANRAELDTGGAFAVTGPGLLKLEALSPVDFLLIEVS